MTEYKTDYTRAARRTWDSAVELPQKCRSVAGYLYGIAAECAVKAIMKRIGIPEQPDERGADPYYAHYPNLAPLLREQIAGRGAAELNPFVADSYLQNWSTKMRYSDGGKVTEQRVNKWREHAELALSRV